MKQHNRGFAAIIILATVLIVGIAGYSLYQRSETQRTDDYKYESPDSPSLLRGVERSARGKQTHAPNGDSDLITYTNKKHGFQFNYSNDATFEEQGANPNYYVVTKELDNDLIKGNSYYKFSIGLVSLFNNENTAEKYASKFYNSVKDSGKCLSEESNSELTLVNFSNKKAYSYKSSCGIAESTIYFTEHSGGIYYINFTSKASGAQKDLAESALDQLLSSLRFLE